MRHAKSSWSFDELRDQERPLNDRGRDDAPRIGQALAERRIVPDLMVSSPRCAGHEHRRAGGPRA